MKDLLNRSSVQNESLHFPLNGNALEDCIALSWNSNITDKTFHVKCMCRVPNQLLNYLKYHIDTSIQSQLQLIGNGLFHQYQLQHAAVIV